MRPLSIVPARLEYACGHAGLVSLPLVKGESRRQRTERVEGAKAAARLRSCDFCGPSVSAAAAEGMTAPNSGPGCSPAVTVDQSDTRTMGNNGHAPIGQPASTTALSTAGSLTDQTSSGGIEPTPKPAAQQPQGTRSSRATHMLGADPEPEEARLARTAEPERSPRRRLSPEQQREVARVYAESTTPTSEIRKRFGIGESSLYRIVQRQGVPLRGRAAATPQPELPRTQVPGSGRRQSSTAGGAQAPAVQPRGAVVAAPTGSSRRGGRGRVSRATPSASRGTSAPGAGGRGQFRIHFRAERVIEARDIREALRQAESLGAIEVTAVTRED